MVVSGFHVFYVLASGIHIILREHLCSIFSIHNPIFYFSIGGKRNSERVKAVPLGGQKNQSCVS